MSQTEETCEMTDCGQRYGSPWAVVLEGILSTDGVNQGTHEEVFLEKVKGLWETLMMWWIVLDTTACSGIEYGRV